jgi:hypothetical protein
MIDARSARHIRVVGSPVAAFPTGERAAESAGVPTRCVRFFLALFAT